jgi:hypothetical protein
MEEKKYVNGIIIKEQSFNNGGSLLKMSIKVEDFISELKGIENNGWANIVVSKRKEPSDKGITHYAKIDDWKPDPDKANSGQTQPNKEEKSDLPF